MGTRADCELGYGNCFLDFSCWILDWRNKHYDNDYSLLMAEKKQMKVLQHDQALCYNECSDVEVAGPFTSRPVNSG